MKSSRALFQKLESQFSCYSDVAAFLASAQKPHVKGLRVNTLKIDPERFLKFHLAAAPTPFCKEGFYIPSEEKLGNHPLHHAGAFYLQEPSAMSAVTALDPRPGDRVLDLCAAPGGKSTQIAARLSGAGFLLSNEIVKSRANILLSNMERMGVLNAAVTNCHPDVIADACFEAFDKVLVDAPCSGEGMIRKDPTILENWSEENVTACALRQQKILNSAARCLKPGGVLVYSTCTFSKEEDEDVIEQFLKEHSEFSLEPIAASFGRPAIDLPSARRILWTDGGEGHFVARLRKSPNGSEAALSQAFPPSLSDGFQEAGGEFAASTAQNRSNAQNHLNAQNHPQTQSFRQTQKNRQAQIHSKEQIHAKAQNYQRSANWENDRRKKGGNARSTADGFTKSNILELFSEFSGKNQITLPKGLGALKAVGERLYLSPDFELPQGIPVIRCGVLLGSAKKGRFEPAHAMYACPAIKTEREISLSLNDPRCGAFLHGEEIAADIENGYCRVLIEGVACGFGKVSGGRLKNGYPKGLRTLK